MHPISQLYYSHQAIHMTTFKAYYDLYLKCKVVSLNGDTLQIPQTLTLIGMGAI